MRHGAGRQHFYGNGFSRLLRAAVENAENRRATVFGYYVNDPERFGIVEFDENGKVVSVERKSPRSQNPITRSRACISTTNAWFRWRRRVRPSARGELEITTLNEMYLKKGDLDVQLLGRGFARLDTGTMDSLVDAADFVRMVEKAPGIKISAPEEIAYKTAGSQRIS